MVIPLLVAFCAIAFAVTQYLIFFSAPMAQGLYFNQKIFYYHVPCAFALFAAVIACGIYSIKYLRTRDSKADDVAAACGDVAILLGAMMLVSGSIWGKAAWGVWWQWEARLTTSLLLWLVVVAYRLVRVYGGPDSSRLAAGLGIFAMIDVPLIYFSVRIWRRLHPEANVVATLDPRMKPAFWLSVALFLALSVILIKLRLVQVRGKRRTNEIWDRLLDEGY